MNRALKLYGRRKGGKWSGAPRSARPIANRATRRTRNHNAAATRKAFGKED